MSTEVTAITSSNEESNVCFMYALMNAIDLSIQTQTEMQLGSSITTSQTSESFEKLVTDGNNYLENVSNDIADETDDTELSKLQTQYSQASTEQAAKETMMTSALEVTQNTTASYSNTIQQLVQTGGAVTNIASTVAQMLKGY